jgi:hypothetical protein
MALYLLGSRLYVGREQGAPEIYVLNASDPASGLPTMGTAAIGAGVVDMQVSGPYAFLATDKSNEEFKILDILEPGAITPVVFVHNCNLPQKASGIFFENDVVYMSFLSNTALKILAPGLPSCSS